MKRLLFSNGDIRTVYEFKDLDEKAKNDEIEKIVNFLVESCTLDEEGDPELDDDVQRACRKAFEMKTPWFAGSYVWEYCEKEILDMPDLNEWLYEEDGTQLFIMTHVGENGEVLKYTYGRGKTEVQIVQL